MTTPNLALASMDTNMLQPSVAFNAAMRDLDALVFLAIQTTTNTPPTTTDPADLGKRWIVGTSPTGAWAGQGNKIALCIGANLWYFLTPKEGWTARNVTTDLRYEYSGTAWATQNFAGGSEFSGMISGLAMEWVSTSSVRVTIGAAHIESTGRVLAAAAAITKSSLSLSNSTNYHLYLYSNSGTPDIEVSTTAPATAYAGRARSKTGDTSRRYVGSIRSNASGQVVRFHHNADNGHITYLSDINSNGLAIVATGTATTSTDVTVSVLPTTARTMIGFMENATPDVLVLVSTPELGAASGSNILQFLRPAGVAFGPVALNSSQQFNYILTAAPASGGFSVWCCGYTFER